MGLFSSSDDHKNAYDQYCEAPKHQAKLSHELIAGAAAFQAAKAYEAHCEANGKPVQHATAKALFAGFVGAAVDRLAETHGLDAYDNWKQHREEAKLAAEQRLNLNVKVDDE